MLSSCQAKHLLPVLVLITVLAVLGCGPSPPPHVSGISIQPEENQIPVGETATLSVEASGTNLRFRWTAARGTITGEGGSVLYTAPDTPGPDAVTVEVESAGGAVVKNLTIQVVSVAVALGETPTSTPPPLPTDTPTLTPTATPLPLPTDTLTSVPTGTPMPKATDTPPPPPTDTPTPTSSVYVLNVQDGDTVAQSLSLVGGYAPEVTDDIWVFVGPLGGHRWPQSPNACAGEGTRKLNDRWEVRIGVGGADNVGEHFEILVTTANAQASQFLAQTLQTWCRSNNYPGLSRDELPAGLTEHQRIIVRRGPDVYGPRPGIPTTELPGQVALEDISNGEALPQSLTVGGTSTSDVTDHIWVLVYPPDGRFYPQSTNACEGISTVQLDGFWETRINLGGESDAGKLFDIIVVLVNEEAHAIFEARQEEGCQTGHFPGYLFIELPPGIDEKDSVSVIRQ